MKLARYIARLGYGSRREVTKMLEQRRVRRRDGTVLAAGDAFDHDDVLIDGDPLDVAPGAVLMLHKPTGYVCSTSEESRLVYELLPTRFLRRTPVIAPIGRLDRDTSGLLLLTDDGPLNHRVTSPRTHLPKTYEARLARDLRGDEVAIFARGTLLLNHEREPLKPARMEVLDARRARVTVTEGRYHQLRRMFAAVGNHVEALHRSAVGSLTLGDLGEGEWRALDAEESARLREEVGVR